VLPIALGAILAVPLLAPAPIDLPLGGRGVPVRIALEVREDGGAPLAPTLAWSTRADGALVGMARESGWDAEVRLEPGAGGSRILATEIHWRAGAALSSLAIRIAWPGAPKAIGRDLAFGPVIRPVRVGRGTPLFVAAGGMALAGGPGIPSARYAPAKGGGETEVTLFLEDVADHPFAVYETCLDRLPAVQPGAPMQFGVLDRKRPLSAAERHAGDVDAARATLYPVAEEVALRPVVVERWPRGARAAVVFTDHADRTDPAALAAVLWGSSSPASAGREGAGFLGHGLRLTKSFFVHARRGGLDDPEIRPLAGDLLATGSEVALHSITGERDDREAVREGLAAAAPWKAATWIDHEPYTNCEAVSSEGWRTDGPYGIRDVLAAAGVRWLWAAGDVGGFGGARVVDVFGADDPARPHPAVYPLPMDPRLWLFESSFFYAPPSELAAALSDAALDDLERGRGLFVAHTYLSAGPATTHLPQHLARLAVRQVQGEGLVIDPDLDAALGRLAARVRAGAVASLTWAEAGDRLRALGEVEVAYRPDGAAEIRNLGEAAIEGLTVAVPEEGIDLAVDGGRPARRADVPGWSRIWFDLAPGARAVLRASRRVMPLPFLER
jgi:hypothetical protein